MGKLPKLRGQHYKPFKGFVPSGYDFLGPFNSNFIGPARSKADQAAREHDAAYTSYKNYFQNSEADAKFIEDTKDATGYGAIAHNLFKFKAAIAPNMGKKKKKHSKFEHEDLGLQPQKKRRSQFQPFISKLTSNPTSPNRKVPTPPTIEPVRKKPITLSTDVSGNVQPAPGAHQGPSDPGPKLIKTQTVPKAVKMADVEMSGPPSDAAANQVTPVSNFQHAFEGIPRQYTTILPWWFNRTDGSVGTTAGSKYNQVFLRMNSIYDIIKSDGLTYAADPTPGVDAADSGAQEVPMWRAYWGQFWEYWTVIECRWKVTGYCTNDAANVQGCVITGYVGQQKPPIVSAGTTDLTYDEYKRWKGFDMQIFKSRGATASGLQQADKETGFTVSGVYHPGDGSHEVAEDELVQTWVRENAVPKEQNLLMIRFIRAPLSAQVAMTYNYRIELEYVVQYKDQKAIWQFPHVATTSVATSLAPSGI